MIKSVFVKYILAFLAIITISFAILAAIISSVVMQSSMDAKESAMAVAADIAKRNIETSFAGSGFAAFGEFTESAESNLRRELSAYSELAEDSFILVSDLDGSILVAAPLPPDYLEKNNISGEIISGVLNHNRIDRFQTLNGVFDERHLITERLLESENGEIYGVIFFCSVSAYEYSFVSQIISTIILSCLLVLIAAMVIIYFITEKIISPVREMSKAAKSFALGRFDARVPPTSNKDEIGELAAAFNTMAAALAVHEETQRTFLSNVSHDLGTPMTSIGGFVDGMLDGTIPIEEHRHYLNIVSAEIKRLSRLVASLFYITRIQAGEKKFNKTNFDICETTREAIIFLEQKINEKNLDLGFDCDEDNIKVYADSDAVRRILDNLIGNAIKFTPEKGIIRINIADNEREKKVHISVYNTGAGIPADDIPYVFDRFYKSDRSRGLDKTGAGLGLFIAKTIIDAHEEKIWVVSEFEKNCEFTFTLQKTQEPGGKYRL